VDRSKLVVGAIVVVGALMAGGTIITRAEEKPAPVRYVGSSKCRLCHLKQFKTWKATKHASNFEALIGAERSDPDCVRCHVTGFGRTGGFVSEEERRA